MFLQGPRTSGEPRRGGAFRVAAPARFAARANLLIPVLLGAVILVLYVAQSTMPANAMRLPGQERVAAYVPGILPQGWAFFTKSPRDVEFAPYAVTADGLTSLQAGPNSAAKNLLGWTRDGRAQGIELALLLHENPLDSDRWTECTTREECAAASLDAPPIRLDNSSPAPTLCGAVALVQEEPRPWAWRDVVDDHWKPKSVLTLEVTC